MAKSMRKQRSSHRRIAYSHGLALRAVAAILILILGGWLVVASSAASLLGASGSDRVLRLAPFDARTIAARSEGMFQAAASGSGPADKDEIVRLSRASLARDPTVLPAWRTLALSAAVEGDLALARRHFDIAESLSRRDSITQIWLIEEYVRNNDVPGALKHYDIALRTSSRVADVLIPILVNATGEADVVGPLSKILAQEPSWASQFYTIFVQAFPSSQTALQFVNQLPPEVRTRHSGTLRDLVRKMIQKGEYRHAWGAYVALSDNPSQALVRNSDFEADPTFSPFEWDLVDERDRRAEQVPRLDDQSQTSLRVLGSGGAIGTVAKQMLMLEPGGYRMSSLVEFAGSPGLERLSWRIECVRAGDPIYRLDAPARRQGRINMTGAFRVPGSGCEAQWLQLELMAPDTPSGAEAWVHNITIERRD
jgi:hypothetical protein